MASIDARLASFDAACATGEQAAEVVASATALIRRCEAVRIAALGRVEETGVWRSPDGTGPRSVKAWAAEALDVPFGRADDLVSCGVALRSSPHLDRLAASGSVSADRLVVASETIAVRPDVASDVCEAAASMDRQAFRSLCRRWRQEREDDTARVDRHRRERKLVTRFDDEGRFELTASGPADDGVELRSLLEPWVEQILHAAWENHGDDAGERMTPAQARWDALLAMGRAAAGAGSAGGGTDRSAAELVEASGIKRPASLARGRGSRVKTSIRVDLPTLLRAAVAAGQLCDQPGLGDLDAATARRLIADGSFLSLIFTNGTDAQGRPIVTDVAHLGRAGPDGTLVPPEPPSSAERGSDAYLRQVAGFLVGLLGRAAGKMQAVEDLVHDRRHPNAVQRSVLEFVHPTCSIPGCTMTDGLEIDHVTPWTDTHETRLVDLDRKCRPHHRDKTTEENTARGNGRRRGGNHDPPERRAG